MGLGAQVLRQVVGVEESQCAAGAVAHGLDLAGWRIAFGRNDGVAESLELEAYLFDGSRAKTGDASEGFPPCRRAEVGIGIDGNVVGVGEDPFHRGVVPDGL